MPQLEQAVRPDPESATEAFVGLALEFHAGNVQAGCSIDDRLGVARQQLAGCLADHLPKMEGEASVVRDRGLRQADLGQQIVQQLHREPAGVDAGVAVFVFKHGTAAMLERWRNDR